MATQASPHGVIVTGENPCMELCRPGTADVILRASYWRGVYSPMGDGNALLVWLDPSVTPPENVTPYGVFTDSPAFARLVTDRFSRYFGCYDTLGFEAMQPTNARFVQAGDGRWYHQVAVTSDFGVLELRWHNILSHNLIQRSNMQVGPVAYSWVTMLCPCASASATLNGVLLPGEARVTVGVDGVSRSNSFLQFATTWVGPLDG